MTKDTIARLTHNLEAAMRTATHIAASYKEASTVPLTLAASMEAIETSAAKLQRARLARDKESSADFFVLE